MVYCSLTCDMRDCRFEGWYLHHFTTLHFLKESAEGGSTVAVQTNPVRLLGFGI